MIGVETVDTHTDLAASLEDILEGTVERVGSGRVEEGPVTTKVVAGDGPVGEATVDLMIEAEKTDKVIKTRNRVEGKGMKRDAQKRKVEHRTMLTVPRELKLQRGPIHHSFSTKHARATE
jgi:hypothetical protein